MAAKKTWRKSNRSYRKKGTWKSSMKGTKITHVKSGTYYAPTMKGNISPVPPSMNTKLIYSTGSTYCAQTIAAGAYSSLFFRGNGPYDPDYQTGGAQPVGFDQYHALYKWHRVVAAKLEYWLGQSANTTTCTFATTSSGAPASWQGATSQTNAIITNAQVVGGSMAGDIYRSIYRRTADVTGTDITNDNLIGSASTTPSDPWYFIFNIRNNDSGTQAFSVLFRVTYWVEFFEPVTLDMS